MTSIVPDPPRRATRPARLRALAVGVGLALVAFELVLQIGAWWNWRREAAGVPAPDGAVVLCVGDSFTFGLGSSSPDGAYPSQVRAQLEGGAAPPPSVVNGGWPGRTSRDVRLRLPEQLRRYRPRLVYVLAGYNDAWAQPAPAEPGEEVAASSFPLRWRTGQLLAMAAHALGLRGVEPAAAAPIGTWHNDAGKELTLEPDGRLRGDLAEGRWQLEDGRLSVDVEGIAPVAMQWGYDGGRLWLQCRLWDGRRWFDPGPLPPAQRGLGEAWGALQAGRAAEAEQRFRTALAADADRIEARAGLVCALAAADPAGARRELATLRDAVAAEPAAAPALIRALAAVGDVDEAIDRACALVADRPEVLQELTVLARYGERPEYRDRVERALRAALGRAGVDAPVARVGVLRALYMLRRQRDPREALELLAESVVLSGNGQGLLVEHLATFADVLPPDAMDEVAAKVAPTPAAARALSEVATQAPEGYRAVYAEHLRQIVELCRAAGAEPVLLEYPEPRETIDGALHTVAAATGTEVLAVQRAFAAALARRDRQELFVPDGHCTDAGYGVLAKVVAADVRRRLRE